MDARLILCLLTHSVLVISGALMGTQVSAPLLTQAFVGAMIALPLLLTLRGLSRANRQTLRWLALLLVLFVGYGLVEVLASQRGLLPTVFLLTSSLEFILVLSLLQRPARPIDAESSAP